MTRSSPPHPDISVSVKIGLGTSRQSKVTLNALIPDNVKFPKGLTLKMSTKGSALFVELSSKSTPVETLLNTLDEILEHVSVCQKVMPK
jgi:hypothetical protein